MCFMFVLQTEEVDGDGADGEETEILPPGWERCEGMLE